MLAVTPQRIGRYLLFDEIGAGGIAVVHVGRAMGTAGFSRDPGKGADCDPPYAFDENGKRRFKRECLVR